MKLSSIKVQFDVDGKIVEVRIYLREGYYEKAIPSCQLLADGVCYTPRNIAVENVA